MSSHKKQKSTNQSRGKPLLLILLIMVFVLAGVYLVKRGAGGMSDVNSMPADAGLQADVKTEPASSEEENSIALPNAVFAPLVGRWLREDGGYVLEITEVKPDGKLTAAYFNPRPIHVSQAAAVAESGGVKIGIELNDVNYPGCLYTLVFDPELDQLRGTYFQAALGETFQIVFVRIPVE